MLEYLPLQISPFYGLTVLLIIATVVGLISQQLRQPMIVSFIVVGILVGPVFLGIVKSHEHIELLAELGVAVLLFLVGLKLDIKLIRKLGKVSLAAGLGQVLFTSILGFIIALSMGMSPLTSFYVSVALTFSSTIIIIKLLSDTDEVDSLHGRVTIGIVIVQDLVVVLAMIMLSSMGINGPRSDGGISTHIMNVLLYGATTLIFIGLFIRYLANPLVGRIAHSPELLVIFAISWAALMAALGSYLGFSKELGGLLAGISLASTPYRDAIAARLSSLRDFLLLFFFVALGSQLNLDQIGSHIVPGIIFSLFVLIAKPLIVFLIMGAMGYRKRTSFLTGVTLAQVSEFSLIFMAMGVRLGHVSNTPLGLVTLVGLITITISVYMITYSQVLYQWFKPVLFEKKLPSYEERRKIRVNVNQFYDVVIFGLGRYGRAIAESLSKKQFTVIAIDFNPDEIRSWSHRGYNAMYGDACDIDFINSLPLRDVKWVICAIPHHIGGLTHQDARIVLTEAVKRTLFSGKIAISTHYSAEKEIFEKMGVDIILQPYVDAANEAVDKISDMTKPGD